MQSLNNLKKLSQEGKALCISTAEGLRTFLGSRPEVLEVRRAFKAEAIHADDIRSFVDDMFVDFARGSRFHGEVVIAAIAVAVETLPVRFAQSFLEDLARVRISELPLAPRVARLSIQERDKRLSQLTVRDMTLSEPVPETGGPIHELRPERVSSSIDDTHVDLVAA